MTVTVVLDWERRDVWVGWEDCAVVTVEAVVMSVGVSGKSVSMSSVGDNVVGDARRVLGRRATVLREGCG